MKPIRFQFHYSAKLPVEQVWSVLSQTDKLNQSMGLPSVKYSESKKSGDVPALLAKAKSMGIELEWEETPFEWIQNHYFSGVRVFHRGPFREMKMLLRLEPKEGKTDVLVSADVTPKNIFYWLLLKLTFGKKIKKDFQKVIEHLNQFAENKEESPLKLNRKIKFNELLFEQRITSVLEEHPEHRPLKEKLGNFLRKSYDNEVIGMRPFVLADQWGEDRREVLKFFLSCARAGVVDLKWAIMCPSCRIPVARQSSLKKLQQEVHCSGCKIKYDTEFDRSVEVRFDVHSAIRHAEEELYCVGNPGSKGEIFAQFILQPEEIREVRLALPETRWKAVLFGQGSQTFSVTHKTANNRADLWVSDSQINISVDQIQNSDIHLTIKNLTNKKRLIQIEDDRFKETAATAALVTSLARFQDLFSSEVLAPGEEIAVRNLTVMFTDLKGSTAFYQQTGDAKAYHLVRSHFGFINEILEKFNGVLVKTIGDAVFAVFFSTLDAVQAAVEIQQKIGEFNAENQSLFEIKLGVHSGPLIAVNANGRIDYFGSTTNIGSRLEKKSHGGDVVVTETVLQDPDTAAWVREQNLQAESLTAQLRGIENEFKLTRLSFEKNPV